MNYLLMPRHGTTLTLGMPFLRWFLHTGLIYLLPAYPPAKRGLFTLPPLSGVTSPPLSGVFSRHPRLAGL